MILAQLWEITAAKNHNKQEDLPLKHDIYANIHTKSVRITKKNIRRQSLPGIIFNEQ